MTNQKWPCVFRDPFTKEEINKRLAALGAPIGAFTRVWRWEHCATLNPYGSDSCPYESEDCALAYFITAQQAMDAHTSKVGLFKALAKRKGIERADNKPLARDTVRTDGLEGRSGGLRGGAGTRPPDDMAGPRREATQASGMAHDRSVGMRDAADRPVSRSIPRSVGSLLWGDAAGSRPRPRRGNEGEEGGHHDGDPRDSVSPSSSERLGDQPSSGDPAIHQGGE